MLELAAVALAAFVIARHLRIRAIWIIIAAFVNASAPQEEYDATVAARDELNRRRAWWHASLGKRAPKLSGGDRTYRGRRRFGAPSQYGVNPGPQFGLSPAEFYSHFRFTREDIPRLLRALRFPDQFRTRSRCVCEGEEALLIYLKRMSYPNRWVDLEFFFCASQGWLSEVCDEVNEHLYEFSYHLINEYDRERIAPLVPLFAEAIHQKGAPLGNIFGLLDGTFRHFCRPARDGYNGIAQQMQYSGHKKCHGNNHQGLVTPDGLIVEMHGPFEGRTNDKRMLRESGLLGRIMRDFPGFCLYGDRGYDHGNPALQVPYNGAVVADDERAYNRQMSDIRQPVEWAFGKVIQNFAFVDFDKNQKLYQQPVAIFYLNAVLLTNCHSCLYGNQTSRYFSVPTPELEDYLANA